MDDMTLDQIRDWHARRLGWNQKGCRWYHPTWHKRGSGQKRHPIPATLDAIAGLMPEGWWWMRDGGITPNPHGLFLKWSACQVGPDRWGVVTTPDTGDELLDRAHLAKLAWEAEGKGAGQ